MFYYVNADTGSNKHGRGTEEKPWSTIQHALNKMKQGERGDTLFITGRCVLTKPLDLTAYGEPRYNRPLMFVGRGGVIDGDGHSIYDGNASHLVFESLELCNSGDNLLLALGGSGIYITNCQIYGTNSFAIFFDGNDLTVGGCHIYDVHGISAITVNNKSYLYRNRIDSDAETAISLNGGTANGNLIYNKRGVGVGIAGNGRITENTLVNQGGDRSVAIQLQGNQLVANNYVIGFGIQPASFNSDNYTLAYANAVTHGDLVSFAIDAGNVAVGSMLDEAREATAKGYIDGWPAYLGKTKTGVNRGASQVPSAERPNYPEPKHVRFGVEYGDGLKGEMRQGGGRTWR